MSRPEEDERSQRFQRVEDEKFDLFYGDVEEDRGCDYDLADECINPDLRDMGNCFECPLFLADCDECGGQG